MEIVRRQCSSRRRAAVPVAKFLMDQSKTAGIGNYVLSEVALPRGPSQHSTTAQPRCHSRWCCLAQLTDCVSPPQVLYKARVYPWAACADLVDSDWAEVHAAASQTLRASYASQVHPRPH